MLQNMWASVSVATRTDFGTDLLPGQLAEGSDGDLKPKDQDHAKGREMVSLIAYTRGN